MRKNLTDLAITTIRVNEYMSCTQLSVQNVFVFSQTWGSTALGFGGWGGDTMTDAWTHVILAGDGKYYVFFSGRFAYAVENPKDIFFKDLESQYMKSVNDAKGAY